MRIFVALAACLALAGCFMSEQPLYAENEGACPVQGSATYAIQQIDSGGGVANLPIFTIARDGRYCVRTDLQNAEAEPERALLVPFDAGWYVVQRDQGESGMGARYLYQLARFEDDGVELFLPGCADFTAAALTEFGVEQMQAPPLEPAIQQPSPPRTKYLAASAKQNTPDAASPTAGLCLVTSRAQLENLLRRWITLDRPPGETGARIN